MSQLARNMSMGDQWMRDIGQEVMGLTKDIKQIQKQLEIAGSTPRHNTQGIMGGFSQHSSNMWPVQKLNDIAHVYNTPANCDLLLRKKNGKMRVSGLGPAMVRLAAISSGHPDAMALAKSQGMPSDYNAMKLEQEFGFCTVQKAATVGMKGISGEVRKVALAENSGQTGGYIIPPQFMNELLTIAGEDAFIEPRAKVVPMNSRTATWPMLDITTAQASGTSPYFGGILAQWQPEAATYNETEPQFKQSEWVAWDLVLYAVASNQLLADNGIGLDALLTELFGQACTWYKEYAYLRGLGAGSSMPLGIINAPAAINVTRNSGNTFKMVDAASMLSHLQIRSWEDAAWVMHQSVIPQLIQMVGAASGATQLVWMSPYGDAQKNLGPMALKLPNAFLNGLPIFFTEKLPQLGTRGDVILADFSRYVIGMRLDLQIDVSPHYLFRNNQLAWRVIARVDAKPWLNSFITDAEGWQVSPFCILN